MKYNPITQIITGHLAPSYLDKQNGNESLAITISPLETASYKGHNEATTKHAF